jgi:hypothetical protein
VKNPNVVTPSRTVLEPTDARQASPRRMNLRVLIGSMLGLAVIGSVLLFIFFKATPAGMDSRPTGAETPPSTAPAAPSPATAPQPNAPVVPRTP